VCLIFVFGPCPVLKGVIVKEADTAGRFVVVAYGGGVNSTALLIEFVRKGIRPGLILFSDTGGEVPGVYAHISNFSAWLAAHGMPEIITVKKGGMPETLEENCLRKKMLPSIAYGFKTCSEKYKIRAQEKFVRHYEPARQALDTGHRLIKVIGYDAGEERRAKDFEHRDYEYWYPLVEWDWDRDKCEEVVKAAGFVPVKSSCFFCLAGETEVMTDAGLRPIKVLAGSEQTLLVPWKNGHFKTGEHGANEYQTRGTWQKVAVRDFGVQELYALELRRGNRTKIIRCTAEHRWVKTDGSVVPTLDLRASNDRRAHYGDALGLCFRPTIGREGASTRPVPSPFGIAQGFVFGDGSSTLANRPVRLRFYGEKDKAMLKWFSNCTLTQDKLPGGESVPVAAEIPCFWKRLPPLGECSSFLLGWLAGYFAADGSVSKKGCASLESSVEANLRFARDVCHMLGVRCGDVVPRQRKGFGGISTLFRLTLSAADLPLDFWLLDHHRQRVEKGCARDDSVNRYWRVVRVRRLGISEHVYCAVVPGVERFALADQIVTGNCPSMTKPDILHLAKENPELLARAMAMEANAKENLITVKGLGRRFSWTEFIASAKAQEPNACQWEGDVEVPCGCYDG